MEKPVELVVLVPALAGYKGILVGEYKAGLVAPAAGGGYKAFSLGGKKGGKKIEAYAASEMGAANLLIGKMLWAEAAPAVMAAAARYAAENEIYVAGRMAMAA